MHSAREIKICLLGDSGVGKTHLVTRFVAGHVDARMLSATVGAAFQSKDVMVNKIHCKYLIWDTAGQEKFRCMSEFYYRGASAAVVVFDVNQPNALEAVDYWINELRIRGPQDIFIVIVGNKIDLRDDPYDSDHLTRRFLRQENVQYFETSALTGMNVEKVFDAIGERLTTNPAAFRPPHNVMKSIKLPNRASQNVEDHEQQIEQTSSNKCCNST